MFGFRFFQELAGFFRLRNSLIKQILPSLIGTGRPVNGWIQAEGQFDHEKTLVTRSQPVGKRKKSVTTGTG